MFFLSVISEVLLYTCFALLIASYIFPLVPSSHKPNIEVPTNLKLIAVAGIALFSFMPVLQLVLYLYHDYGAGQALETVLISFKIGNSWLYTFGLSLIFGFYITLTDEREHQVYTWVGLGMVFLLVLGLGWASHASSIIPIAGFAIHTLHFLAVTIWVGLLLIVSWFSKDINHWLSFLKWFHLTALCCFIVTIISGLILMNFSMDWSDYNDAWTVPYGQSLLIKHLLIIPLVGYAVINGVLMKKKMQLHPEFDPRPWTKIECLVILLIFAVTGALSQQSPPSNLATIIDYEGLSPLFSLFYRAPGHSDFTVEWMVGGSSILFTAMAIIFLVIGIASFIEKMSPFFSFVMALFFVLCGYLALMNSIVVL
ncbi:copper resistance D family protein [Oceanobacillus massiliensis]|uniref:copper resistance D family protein n=1 Tax=Oceanobacillus massiliensis TaxID=1465765 RepID=UPI000288B35F|nr:CopD family protein [Oceanobacillus massiliensis]